MLMVLYHGTMIQVSQLIAQLFQMRVRMKNLMGVMQSGSVPALSNLEEALKSEQKVSNIVAPPAWSLHFLFSFCRCLSLSLCPPPLSRVVTLSQVVSGRVFLVIQVIGKNCSLSEKDRGNIVGFLFWSLHPGIY